MGKIWIKQQNSWQVISDEDGCTPPLSNGSITFTKFTSFFTVPPGVCVLKLTMSGGAGQKMRWGKTQKAPLAGARITCTFQVKAGEQFIVQRLIGGPGYAKTSSSQTTDHGGNPQTSGAGGDSYAFGPWNGTGLLNANDVWVCAGASSGCKWDNSGTFDNPPVLSAPARLFEDSGYKLLEAQSALVLKSTAGGGGAGYYGGKVNEGGSSRFAVPSNRNPNLIEALQSGGAATNTLRIDF